MQNLKEMENEVKVHTSTRTQRRLLVVGSSLMVLFFLIGGAILPLTGIGEFGKYSSWFLYLIAFISFICQCLLYWLNTTRIANMSEKEIDERQKRVRDQAYQHAYRILTWIATIVLISLLPLGILYFQRHIPFVLVFTGIGFLWLMLLLPTWVIAWTERDI